MTRRIVSTIAVLLALLSLRSVPGAGARTVHPLSYANRLEIALPDTTLSFDFQTRQARSLSVDIFRVDRATYDRIHSGDQEEIDFRTAPVRHASHAVIGSYEWYTTTHLDFPGLPIGLYAVRVNAGKMQSIDGLDITTFGLLNAENHFGSLQYAVDLRTFHKRSDVVIEARPIADNGGAVAPIHVDADGTALVRVARANVAATAEDGSIAFATAYGRGSVPDRTDYLQVDRPLYRPGDVVSYRIITRTGRIGTYAAPDGSTRVTLTDPSGKKLFDDTQTYDAYGTVSGTFKLADDTELGHYDVGEGDRSVGTFTVEAYEKPEYIVDVTTPKRGYVIAGDAATFDVDSRYFFGKPAAGIHLHYHAHAGPAEWWWYSRSLDLPLVDRIGPSQPGEFDVSGDVAADAQGHASIAIPTQTEPLDEENNQDRTLEIDVDGRDASGKTVTAHGLVPLTRASLRLGIAFDRWFATSGDDVNIDVTSKDFSNAVRAHVPVTLSFEQWNYRPAAGDLSVPPDLRATTGDDGVAHFKWHADQEGYLRVIARASDDRGHATSSVSYIWISGASYQSAYNFQSASVTAQKATYAPGETAHLLVTAPRADVDALVNVAYGNHDRTYVQHLDTVASTIDVTTPAEANKFAVTVWVPGPNGFSEGVTAMSISPAAHHLTVTVKPGKAKYVPGEIARFALDVRDEHGKPTQAEVGVGVVDDAVLALAEPNATDPFDLFYGSIPGQRYASANWNLGTFSIYTSQEPLRAIGRVNARNASSAFQPTQTTDTYTVSAQAASNHAPSFEALRSDFRDTAYWSPSVVTDRGGHASVAFRWPDNLTSYTAAGLAVTQETSIGSGTGKALVTKDYLVRLSTPRFMRRYDTARFVASASGPKGATVTQLRFAAPGLGLPDRTVTVKFDRYASATSTFKAASGDLGPSLLRLAGTSGELTDGLRRSLPVESVGVETHERYAGALPSRDSVSLDLPDGADRGTVRIYLSPSIVARLYQNTQLLDVYPYYCVEQTMSAALPLIDVERLTKRSGLPFPEDSQPDLIAAHAIARLEKLQHDDVSGDIDPSFVITHRLTLAEAPSAFKMFRDKTDACVKVVMHP